MSHWNYRIFRKETEWEDEPYWFFLGEAYYDDDGNVTVYSQDPVGLSGGSTDDLKQIHEWVSLAFKKPVLDWETGKEITDE